MNRAMYRYNLGNLGDESMKGVEVFEALTLAALRENLPQYAWGITGESASGGEPPLPRVGDDEHDALDEALDTANDQFAAWLAEQPEA